jgi:hypothetical protein
MSTDEAAVHTGSSCSQTARNPLVPMEAPRGSHVGWYHMIRIRTFGRNVTHISILGHAIAQAVCHRLPTAAARVRAPDRVIWDLWWTKWH